jgi:hypothetical protein
MKINEIVTEGDVRKASKNALPNLQSFPHLDNNANPYLAYRFGIELAGAPDVDADQRAGTGSDFVTVGYSDADDEIIAHAAKKFGLKRKTHGGKNSVESSKVNKVSPVAAPKKNKYGV